MDYAERWVVERRLQPRTRELYGHYFGATSRPTSRRAPWTALIYQHATSDRDREIAYALDLRIQWEAGE